MSGDPVQVIVTTKRAAQLAKMSVDTFRSTMYYARKTYGKDFRLPGPDNRTPLWSWPHVKEYLDNRPGRGRWGQREKETRKRRSGASDE